MSSQKKEESVVKKYYIIEKIPDRKLLKGQYLLKLKDLPGAVNVWKPLHCPELIKAYEDSLKSKSSDKRKLIDTGIISCGCDLKKAAIVDTQRNINSLPEELLVNIFKYLTQNELGSIARVCKNWHEITRYSVLWKKVEVRFHCCHTSQSTVAENFYKSLPTCITHLKLDFQDLKWAHSLNIEKFCVNLAKSPSLKALIFHYCKSSHNLQSVLHLCRHYMQNLEILSFHHSIFSSYPAKEECGECVSFSKIKILDLYNNYFMDLYNSPRFIKMSNLKKLNLVNTNVNDSWFKNDISFLQNLEMLNVRLAYRVSSGTFRALKDNALKLTELYLCGTRLRDSDFRFHKSVFPELKTICLRGCHVTCENIVSLIHSCHCLQNVYVNPQVVVSYAQHPFVVVNRSKLEIVKTTDNCWEHYEKNYLCEQ